MSRFESKGTWFETNGTYAAFRAQYPRIKFVFCPVCCSGTPTLGTGPKVRVMSYAETLDKESRLVMVKLEAQCLCGTVFYLERLLP